MNVRLYMILTSFVLGVAGVLHLARIIMGADMQMLGWEIPVWVSAVTALVCMGLAAWGAAHCWETRR